EQAPEPTVSIDMTEAPEAALAPEQEEAPAEGYQDAPVDAARERELYVESLEVRLDAADARMKEAYDAARHRRWYHGTARRELAYSSLFGSGPEADAYASAEAGVRSGELLMKIARSSESSARAVLAKASTDAGLTVA